MRYANVESRRSAERDGNTAAEWGVVTPMAVAAAARAPRARSAILGILLAAACVACGSPAASLEPLAPGPPTTATATRDGVTVTLTLEGPPRSSALSWADLAIENGNAVGARWAGGGCGDPGGIFIDLGAAFAPGREWPGLLGRFKRVSLGQPGLGGPTNVGYIEASKVGQEVACPAALRREELAPGGKLTMRAAWDGRIQGGAAPAGPAIVEASFPLIGLAGLVRNDEFNASPIVARIETTVVAGGGGPPPLAPGLAIDVALADPQFAAFVNANPEGMWINPDVGVIAGTWNVGLFVRDPAGGGERMGSVKVDHSGRIVGRSFLP